MPAIHAPSKPFTDLKKSGATVSEVLTHGTAEGWEEIISNPNLKSLTVHSLTDERAALLGKVKNLEKLVIKNCSASDLSALGGLGNLRSLKISTAMKPKDFSFLGGLKNLNRLEFSDVTKFKDAGILEKLPLLHTMKILKLFSKLELPTLRSFAKLKQLRNLHLNVYAVDGSLSPLAELSNLDELGLSLHYELQSMPNSLWHCRKQCAPISRSLTTFGQIGRNVSVAAEIRKYL